ncbi:MAG TPA: hypothetical protein VFZ65_10115 [Planctomycetota bacterium]|nr:hypothetical protein [Planctomycetota bacterium]
MKARSLASCWLLLAVLPPFTACSREREAAAAERPPATHAAGSAPRVDVALAPFREQLLKLAFRAASAFPLEPHRKNRSRIQGIVVAACFELDQPELAVAFARDITDWRRGCGYADYAHARALRGDARTALDYIRLAGEIIEQEQHASYSQEWQIDSIRQKIARAYETLGDEVHAAEAVAHVDAASGNAVDTDWAKTAADHVRLLPAAKVDDELAAMDAAFPQMSIGQQQVALETLARLHGRFFDDLARRTKIEERVTTVYTRLPPAMRLDALRKLARTCIEHHENGSALRLLGTAREIASAHTWRAEDQVPELAKLAAVRHEAGEADQAAADVAAALALYHAERDHIVDIYRAETVRAIAEAVHSMGDDKAAVDLCALAIEEGMHNANSRPRAEDLVETCVAMAVRGIEPSPELWQRLREICEGLGDPW